MLLSVCIITYNEEKFIKECILSVKEIADEIIIIDAFSTDATKQICMGEQCSFFQYEWENNYALARNRAIEKAQGSWILFLDADEELLNPRNLLNALKAEIDNISLGGFILERTDIFRNKESGKIYKHPIGIVRAFRNHPLIKYRSPIHEEVNSSIEQADFRLKVLHHTKIKHKVNESSDALLYQKQQKYLAMLDLEVQKDPSNWWAVYHQAKTLWFFDQRQEATNEFLKVAQSTSAKTDLRVSAYCNAATLCSELGNNAHLLLDAAHQLMVGAFVICLSKADILYKDGQYLAALRLYSQIPSTLKSNISGAAIPGGVYLRPEMKFYKIGCCLYAMEMFFLAKLAFKWGHHLDPSDPINLYGYSILNKKMGKRSEAMKGFEDCQKIEPNWKRPAEQLMNL